ncbi:MAG TPA: WecB/TagA/CpsF family glycosyltransferase [Acidobacteriaceae bacterium]|nr:WecB/TagA/CpsF family glycosyltransferase [Acidobacteriaceae bacterium]
MPLSSSKTVAVLGIPFHNVTMDETVSLIEEQIKEGGFHQIATANVDFLKNAIADPSLRSTLCSCDVVIPDGMPVLWISRLLGTPLKERVTGIDLVSRLAQRSAEKGYGIFLLGSSEVRSQLAAHTLTQRYPGLRIVGRYSPPPAPIDKMDHEDILRRIEAARPDILLVAFGNPKQEQWLAMHRDRLKVPVAIGVGGSLDALSGGWRRAPRWMQASGLEWLHRVSQEPRRLTARYLSDALCLMRHLPHYLAASARQPRNAVAEIFGRQIGNTQLIGVSGDLTGPALELFNDLGLAACLEGMNIVVDLSGAGYLSPESLGALIFLENRMRRRNEQLWLAGLPRHLRRVLRAGQLRNYFLTTTMVSDALYRTAKAEQRQLAVFTPALGAFRQQTAHVRVELLQNACRRIVSATGSTETALSPAAFANAGR